MTARTPPLPALRAFSALVRLGSVSAAAEELSLTQGAVAHQIRALEEFLEVSLVDRVGRRLVLTEAGRIYGYQVRQALDDIVEATERARRKKRASSSQAVRVSVLPSFAYGWLLPRLQGFRKLYPDIRLAIHGSMEYADLEGGRVDCAIRFGHGNWPNAVIRPLMPDRLLLVAAPDLLKERTARKLEQVLRFPLLHSSENWSAWLSSMPQDGELPQRPVASMEFSDSTHLLEAARLGLGVALTRRSIADGLLLRRELVPAFPHECEHSSNYYALVPTSAPADQALECFLGWIQTECAQFSRANGWAAFGT